MQGEQNQYFSRMCEANLLLLADPEDAVIGNTEFNLPVLYKHIKC